MHQIVKAPDLHTNRLHLKEISEENTSQIVAWRSDPEIYQFFIRPHQITRQEHLKWFHNSYLYDGNRFDWIAYTSDEEPIGIFGIKRNNNQSEKAEVSYILSPNHYGKGYASECVERLIDFCRDEWRCITVFAEIHKENTSSIRFIQKNGFTKKFIHGDFIIFERAL